MTFVIKEMTPSNSARNGRSEVYPFSKLEKGQGFFVPNSEVPSGDATKTLKQTAYQAQVRIKEKTGNSVKFVVESGTEENVQGANVIRTE